MGKYDYYSHNVQKDNRRYLDTSSRMPRTFIALFVLLLVIVLIVVLDRIGLLRIGPITRLLDRIAGFFRGLFGGG